MSISIAMATFNGAKFLPDQLRSLRDQTAHPLELVVGDDGSSDCTIKILDEFRKCAPFPVHIHQNETTLGHGRNFLSTAQRCHGDWIAFCDQDDVWLPNKLADAARAIERSSGCSMVLQNAWLCDSLLNSRNQKFPNTIQSGLHGAGRQYGFWVWLGFLQTVNQRIFQIWDNKTLPKNYFPKYPEISHDKWTCMIANAIGGIVVLDEPAALYRRHDAALTGDYRQKSLGERITKARSVASDHYDFLADVAGDCSHYMGLLSQRTENPKWALALHESSCDFARLKKTQQLRAQLYAGRRFEDRLASFFVILRERGYFGSPFTAMGSHSAAKDALRVVFGKT